MTRAARAATLAFMCLFGHVRETMAQEPAAAAPGLTLAEVLENTVITGRGSSKETRHLELRLDGSGITYEPGDALGVVGRNDPRIVDELLGAARLATVLFALVKIYWLISLICIAFWAAVALSPSFLALASKPAKSCQILGLARVSPTSLPGGKSLT